MSYIPADLAEGTPITDPNPGPGGIYARLEEQGHTLERFTEEVAARMPTPEEARVLALPPGVPVFRLVRTAYDVTAGRSRSATRSWPLTLTCLHTICPLISS